MRSWIGFVAIFALLLALGAAHPSVSRADDASRLGEPQLEWPPADRYFADARAREREGNGPGAVAMYRRAVEWGSREAARRLGVIYADGIRGVQPDPAEAKKWQGIARGTEHDVPGAAPLEKAAALERAGKGPEAVQVYVRAARAGNGKAALRLGDIYSLGILSVERDGQQAANWYYAAYLLGENERWGMPR